MVALGEVTNGEEMFLLTHSLDNFHLDDLQIPGTNCSMTIVFDWVTVEVGPYISESCATLRIILKKFVSHIETNLSQFEDHEWTQQQKYWEDQNNYLHEMQDKLFLELLNKCDKIAIVLPNFMCQDFYKRVNTIKPRYAMYTGKETYSGNFRMFYLEGSVPRHVIRRLKGIGHSGIWEWKSNITNEYFSYVSNQKRIIEKPTMRGNVLIIFIFWLGGIAVTGIIYTCEFVRGEAKPCNKS